MGLISLGNIAAILLGAFSVVTGIGMFFYTPPYRTEDKYTGIGVLAFGVWVVWMTVRTIQAKRKFHGMNMATLEKFLADKGVNKENEVYTDYALVWIDTESKKVAILLEASSLYERPEVFSKRLPIVVNFSDIDNWQHTWLRSSSGSISNNVLEIRTFRHDLPVIKVKFLDHSKADAFSQRLRIYMTPQAATA